MLLQRSILLQLSLFLIIFGVKGQRYSSEYEVTDGGDGEHHSSYSGGSDSPDYTSYFKNDASSPLITGSVDGNAGSSGFIHPGEFSSFFNSPDFGLGSSSNKQEVLKPPNPLIQEQKPLATGFVSNSDFAGFSSVNSDPFSRDFFEQSAQKQNQKNVQNDEESETRPGPSYISHRIPAKLALKDPLKRQASEVEDLNSEPEYYGKYRHEDFEDEGDDKENLEEENDKEELNDEGDDDDRGVDEDEKKSSQYVRPNSYDFGVKHYSPKFGSETKNAPQKQQYNSALVEQLVPYYYNKYQQNQNAKPTPYQKYSFQPVNDFGINTPFASALQSTVAPYNPTYTKLATSNVPKYESQSTNQNSKKAPSGGKKCKKINKDVTEKDIRTGRFKRQAMNCFVCEDPKNGANYEQCSYSSDPNEKSYFSGKSEKYSNPHPASYRYKRYTDRQKKRNSQDEEKDDYVDPYDKIKSESHKFYSQPEEFTKSYYNPKPFPVVEDYRFPQKYFQQEDDKEKSESEIVSEKLVKDGENCKKVQRKSMTCLVCENPKTGGNYEQCSYTSAPAEKKYAYVRERKFDDNDNPIEDKEVESSDPQETVVEEEEPASRRSYNKRKSDKERLRQEEEDSAEEDYAPKRKYKKEKLRKSASKPRESRRRYNSEEHKPKESKKQEDESSYEIPEHFVETTTRRQKSGIRGLDPALYGSADSVEEEEAKKKNFEREIEDYHHRIYKPGKYNQESESKNEEKRVKPSREEEFQTETKKDVEEVLAEFAKKDRSKCKKAYKNGMTCYLCIDKHGIKNEECMYVSESQPQSTHVAYHEVKKVKGPEADAEESEEDGKSAESKQKSVTREIKEKEKKRKRQSRKAGKESSDEQVSSPSSRKSNSPKSRATTSTPVQSNQSSRPQRVLRRTKNFSARDAQVEESRHLEIKEDDEAEPTIKTPKEFAVGDEDGAYTLETRPVYSKVLGLSLPKYMLEVSEHERDFDEASRH